MYLAASGTPTLNQREMAALLYGDPKQDQSEMTKAVITGAAALRYRHVTLPDSGWESIDLLIPAEVRRQSVSFVTVHRTNRMPAMSIARGRRLFAPDARAVADAARDMTDLRAVRALVSSAVQKKCCSAAAIRDELYDGPIRGSALLAVAVEEVTGGVRSAPEAELRGLIRKAGLPMPMFNPKLYLSDGTFIGQPDAWWPEAGVAVEVDSRAWHSEAPDWERTMDRHSDLGQYGIVTLHFSPYKLRRRQAFVISRMRNAVRTGRARTPLDIKAVPVAGSAKTAARPATV